MRKWKYTTLTELSTNDFLRALEDIFHGNAKYETTKGCILYYGEPED